MKNSTKSSHEGRKRTRIPTTLIASGLSVAALTGCLDQASTPKPNPAVVAAEQARENVEKTTQVLELSRLRVDNTAVYAEVLDANIPYSDKVKKTYHAIKAYVDKAAENNIDLSLREYAYDIGFSSSCSLERKADDTEDESYNLSLHQTDGPDSYDVLISFFPDRVGFVVNKGLYDENDGTVATPEDLKEVLQDVRLVQIQFEDANCSIMGPEFFVTDLMGL